MDAVGKVRAHFENLATTLKDIEARTIVEIETVCTGIKDGMQESTDEAEHIEVKVNDCLGKMSAESFPTDAQRFINMKRGESLVASADQVLQETEIQFRRKLGTYHLDRRIETYLGKINTVGCFQPTYSVTNKVSYMVQMSGEGECDIRYACLLPDGRVLLSEYSNKKLKCFSPSSNTVTENCSMPVDPRGVCCVSTQEVAVALNGIMIQFVTFTPSLAPSSRSFTVDHFCQGMAYRNDCLFITDWGTKVYIHNLDGSLVQVITVPGVTNAFEIALSPGGELLYVACNIGLVCLERCGRPVYTREARRGPYLGVSVDEVRCVVVCGYSSERVVQVGEDGEEVAELMCDLDGISRPMSICMDSSNMKLYVTSQNKNELFVADIESK